MPITFYCTVCTQKLRIDDDFAGKLIACTRCGSKLRVPPESQAARPRRTERPRRKEPEPEAESREAERLVEEAIAKPPAPAVKVVEPPERLRPREEARAVAAAVPHPGHKPEPEAALVRPAMKIDFEDLIDMTAMVDIVFFLLIFFLVTSMKAIDSTVPMPVPDPQKAAASEPRALSDLESDNEYITVHIDRNDRITVNDTEVHNERDLLFKLRELRTTGNRPEKLMVVGHGDATHGTAVMIMDTGREAGIEHVRLAVADETE